MKIATPLLGTLMLPLLLGGCLRYYTEPEKAVPQATLHMITNHPHLTWSSWWFYSDSQCTTASREVVGLFTAVYNGEKNVRIKANDRKYLIVRTVSRGLGASSCPSGSVCATDNKCTLEFELTPVEGRTYRAQQSGNGFQCSVAITDEKTGAAAEGVKQIRVDPGCK